MRSCSALTPHCAYQSTLSRKRPRSPYAESTAAEGTKFGALVQNWIEGRPTPESEELDEIYESFRELRGKWLPPPDARCEVALGLGRDGSYVPVIEIYPHYYVPSHVGTSSDWTPNAYPYYLPAAGPQDILATSGRNDVAWINGNVAVVLDMKRSAMKYPDPETVPQLQALGVMWALANGLDWFQTGLYGLRDGVFVWAQEIQAVADVLPEVLRMAALPEDEPITGPHCQACYERAACPPGNILYPIKKRVYKKKG